MCGIYMIISRVYVRSSLKGGQMLSIKIKGGSGTSTNYEIRCAKNPKGGGGAKAPPGTLILHQRESYGEVWYACIQRALNTTESGYQI